MNASFVEILQKLIAEQGKEILLNSTKCKAFLADYTRGEDKKETRLLLLAIEAGTAKSIIEAQNLELCKKQQIRILQEEYFWADEIVMDIVDTLAFILRGNTTKSDINQRSKSTKSNKTKSSSVKKQTQSQQPQKLKPPTPNNLHYDSLGSDSIRLIWDSIGSGASYKIYWSSQNTPSNATEVLTVPTFDCSMDLNQLTANTDYYFWVTSIQNNFESSKSVVLHIRTPNQTPSYPISFSVIGGHGRLIAEVGGQKISSGDLAQHGKTIEFTAKPNSGYQVEKWNGKNSFIESSYSYCIRSALNITVEFKEIKHSVIFNEKRVKVFMNGKEIKSGTAVSKGSIIEYEAKRWWETFSEDD